MNPIRLPLTARRGVTALTAALALATLTGCATLVRVSQSVDNVEGNSASRAPSINFDGRWVAFESWANNLTANTDANNTPDVFVRDQQSGAVQLVSTTTVSASGNGASDQPSVSDDGTRVAFRSTASNLVATAAPAVTQIYVRDRSAGTTTRVSVATNGTVGNGASEGPRISGNGRYVTFSSSADNLVANDGNQQSDVFVHDLVTSTTTAVSVTTSGAVGNGPSSQPAINQDGRYVAFASTAANLVGGDTNTGSDVFRRDRTAGVTIRLSVTTAGTEAQAGSSGPAINGNGSVIAYESTATNLIAVDANDSTDVFVRNVTTQTTNMASVDNGSVPTQGSSHTVTISADARYVAFVSWGQLVPEDENFGDDIYVRDRSKQKTRRISTTPTGGEINEPNEKPSLSGDGRSIAFQSISPDFVSGDTNQTDDVFVRSVTVPSISSTAPGSIARGASTTLTINGTGFFPGTTVVIPTPGINVGPVTIQSETALTVPISAVTDATTGTATIWVVLPGTGAGSAVSASTLCPCLTVT